MPQSRFVALLSARVVGRPSAWPRGGGGREQCRTRRRLRGGREAGPGRAGGCPAVERLPALPRAVGVKRIVIGSGRQETRDAAAVETDSHTAYVERGSGHRQERRDNCGDS